MMNMGKQNKEHQNTTMMMIKMHWSSPLWWLDLAKSSSQNTAMMTIRYNKEH
jgi:hypothetical protein